MNTGIQDAMNLGWKLAAAVHGTAAPWLLDSYEGERHPVGEQVLKLTDTFNRLVLGRSKVRNAVQALAIRAILRFPRSRLAMAERISGIGIGYPARSGADHAWAGRRMPDLDCEGTRLYEHLRDGRFVLVTGNRSPSTARRPCAGCAPPRCPGRRWCWSGRTDTSPGRARRC